MLAVPFQANKFKATAKEAEDDDEEMSDEDKTEKKEETLQEKGVENYTMIDCQMYTEHLESLGAEPISRSSFLKWLKN